MLLTTSAKGVFAISATPFSDGGELDLESTDALVDFYLGRGIHGLTILGIMGEAQKLDPDEAVAFAERVLTRVGGRVPVVVGVTSPGTRRLAVLARRVMDRGAAGVMVAPLEGLRNEEQISAYFEGVFSALDPAVPVCLQDYPQGTGVHMSAALIGRLIETFARIVVLKHEDCPGLRKLSRIRRDESGGRRRRVGILVGNGALYFPQELGRGADGAMTGFAYPEALVAAYERFAAADAVGAEDVFDTYLPLIRYEQQPGIGLAIRKEILRRRGAIRSSATRVPGPALDADDHAELTRLIERLERRLGDRRG